MVQNFDTDEIIDLGSDDGTFLGINDSGRHNARKDLIRRFEDMQSRQHNQEWVEGLAFFLHTLVDSRYQLVETWIETNISRFPSENPDIRRLKRDLDGQFLELKSNAELCGATCDDCFLSCLLPKRHEGVHDCASDHQCHQVCQHAEQHDEADEPCGFK